MPLITDNYDTQSPVSVPTNPVNIAHPEFRGITVASRYTPRRSLISYVTGSKWMVNYYSQVVEAGSGTSSHQLSRPGYAQSYTLIKQFIFKVSQPLQDTQDQSNTVMELKGGANVMPGVFIPNVGDVFLADIGDGTEGYFEITVVEKLSAMRDSVYAVEYSLVQYSTPEIVADLKTKTVKEVYFRPDFYLFGAKPTVVEEDMEYITALGELFELSLDNYFKRYFDDESSTLTVPNQQFVVYDPYLTGAIGRLLTTEDHPKMMRLKQLNVNRMFGWDVVDLWTALIEKTSGRFDVLHSNFTLLSRREFLDVPLMNSIRYSAIDYCVWPLMDTPIFQNNSHNIATIACGQLQPSYPNPKKEAKIQKIHDVLVEKNPTYIGLPLYNPISLTGPYILSQDFYDGNAETSLIEVAVKQHLLGEYSDPALIKALLESTIFMNDVESYYYSPIIWILSRNYVIRVGQ